MRRWATVAVAAVLMSPPAALGQYTFGDWARDHGYSPGDSMPYTLPAVTSSPAIDSLNGIGEFDWTTRPTVWLSLHGNQISSIESDDFSGLPRLRELDLSYNELSSIESGDFSGLTDLTWLNLVGNQISSIESGTFNGLTNLTALYLRGNQLSSIESSDFNGLMSLKELDLRSNQLSSIESGDFSGLTNLDQLFLDLNQLSSIESGDFSELTNLELLGLSLNQISSIESGDFSGLTNLESLWLESNQLSSIESGTFSGLTNLTSLVLENNQLSSIESGDFSGLPRLRGLWLSGNQISSIEPGDFSGLTDLTWLGLGENQISSIESGAFGGLTNLADLWLGHNMALTQLTLAEAVFSNLSTFSVRGNANIGSVSLRNTVVNQTGFAALLDGGGTEDWKIGIGDLPGIAEMDLSGVDFGNITDLDPLYVMDDLTDLWLVDTQNLDATDLDALLDNLETIESVDTEGILYMTQADFDAFGGLLAAWTDEPGHHVEFLAIGDVNHDTEVNGLDVDPFVRLLVRSQFDVAADINGDGVVNGLDVEPFVTTEFGGLQQIPEPPALLLCLVALGVIGGWRKWGECPRKRHVMRRLATLAVVVVSALMSPTATSGRTFGDWARDHGYNPGDAMPEKVWPGEAGINSLDGIGDFDWTTTPTTSLNLDDNSLSSIEPGAFSGLTNLTSLNLGENRLSSIESGTFSGLTNLESLSLDENYRLSSIESGAFSGLTNLTTLRLDENKISSIEPGDFSGLTNLTTLDLSDNEISSVESGAFNGLTNLTTLDLSDNEISSIEWGAFSGLTNLTWLDLGESELSSLEWGAFSGLTNLTTLWLGHWDAIESGTFSGLTNLESLYLGDWDAAIELNLAEADFSSLTEFNVRRYNQNIGSSVSLKNTVMNQMSLAALLDGSVMELWCTGIGELEGITKMDLSGIDFANITDLEPLYVMDDLTDLWLVNTQNVDATALDELLDNLTTIEGTDTEGVLYMTQADFDAFGDLLAIWNDEPGHHVEYLKIGDVNHDTEVNGPDVDPFVDVLLTSRFDVAADMNGDGAVNGLDVDPFVAAVVRGTQSVPEPSTLLLCIVALGVVGISLISGADVAG